MDIIIWAIGSMVGLMLIIFFLPIGYTLKGKFVLVVTSFILSLVGLAAVSFFPLWQTLLMLFALIFFVAYFMNNRLGTLILQEKPVNSELIDEEFKFHETIYDIDSLKDVEIEEINEELVLPKSAYINIEKDPANELIPSPVMTNNEEVTDNKLETIDEDISFLLERNIEEDVYNQSEVTNTENDFLSDIESLLEIEFEQEDLHDRSPNLVKDMRKFDEKEKESLDDSLFDFLLAQKEVAPESEDFLNKIETKEQVRLQK